MQENAAVGLIPGLSRPVSRLFFGTAMPALMKDTPEGEEILDAAAEEGVCAFDCARSYGRAEEVLGDWIRRRGNREKAGN